MDHTRRIIGEAFAAARRGEIPMPEDGEEDGDPCEICGAVPRWVKHPVTGNFRLVQTHFKDAHKGGKRNGGQRELDIRPPSRTTRIGDIDYE